MGKQEQASDLAKSAFSIFQICTAVGCEREVGFLHQQLGHPEVQSKALSSLQSVNTLGINS